MMQNGKIARNTKARERRIAGEQQLKNLIDANRNRQRRGDIVKGQGIRSLLLSPLLFLLNLEGIEQPNDTEGEDCKKHKRRRNCK